MKFRLRIWPFWRRNPDVQDRIIADLRFQLREKDRVVQFIGTEREVLRNALIRIETHAREGMEKPQPLQGEFLAFIQGYAIETVRTSGTPKT